MNARIALKQGKAAIAEIDTILARGIVRPSPPPRVSKIVLPAMAIGMLIAAIAMIGLKNV